MSAVWRALRWLTFADANDIVAAGNSQELEADDILPVRNADKCDTLKQQLEASWDRELTRTTKPSLWRALAHAYGKRYALLAAVAFCASMCKLSAAILLGRFIRFLQDRSMPLSEGAPYGVGLVLSMAVFSLLENHLMFQSMRIGINARTSVVSLLYSHILKLSLSTLPPAGQTLNVVSNDVQRLEDSGPYLMFIVVGPIETVIVFGVAWSYLSYAAAASFGVLIATVLFVSSLSSAFARVRTRVVTARDSRIKLLNDILRSVEMLKMYAWEKPFIAKVTSWRMREVKAFKHWYALKGIASAFFWSASGLMSLAGFFTVFFAQHQALASDRLFTALLLFNTVRVNMAWRIPKAIEILADLRVAMRRIQALLAIEPSISSTHQEPAYDATPEVAAELRQASFSWSAGTTSLHTTGKEAEVLELKSRNNVLRDIDLSVRRGQCIAVIGQVGSGKSSLLLSLLHHTRLVRGDMRVSPRLSYVPQSTYIFSGTIKSNITMGPADDAALLDRVVDICELRQDIARWEQGLDTRIGERGVRVSGGQRARICLARALYHDSPLYLFDDVFSALDAQVASNVFAKLKQHTQDKAVVIVTHHLGLVQQCDRVVLLEQGAILAQGTYQRVVADAQKLGGGFSEVLAEFDGQHHGKDTAHAGVGADDGEQGLGLADDEDDDWNEQRARGTVGSSVYKEYFQHSASLGRFIGAIGLGVIASALSAVADWWLSYWSSQAADEQRRALYWHVYIILILLVPVFSGLATFGFFFISLNSSNHLFMRMLNNVLRATPFFFQTNPPGRILNRLAKDTSLTDEMLPDSLCEVIRLTLYIVSVLVVVCTALPWLILALVPIIALFIWLRSKYLAANRQIRRIESLLRSPVYAHLVSSIEGMTTLTAHSLQPSYYRAFCALQDTNIRSLLSFYMVERWLCCRVDALATLVIIITTVLMTALRHTLAPSIAILAQMYVLNLVDSSQYAVRKAAELELQFVAAERILEYAIDLPLEASLTSAPGCEPPADWPEHGSITLQNMTLQYPGSQAPSLKDLSLQVAAGEKVGIVGRTGAGKSSIINCLFRLAEPTPAGSIVIDGVDISRLGLYDLRSRLSIIPQSLFLFQGSVRYNLDPLEQFSDQEVWQALDAVKLRGVVEQMHGKLDDEAQVSAGEGQLLQLARVILRQSKVLVLDECSSNVDVATDRIIQRTIRDRFRDATVLTIAHRIDTILDNDKILVLDQGRVAEHGTVQQLLQHESGVFRALAEQSLGRDKVIELVHGRHTLDEGEDGNLVELV
ncbi:hypothetical protein RI367_008318 [Sorochytrium milnesiophthora]